MAFDIPIILIFYKRKTVLDVLEKIRKIKPKILYLFQEGPKNDEEKLKIIEVRKEVLKKIDWNCNLNTFFQEKNLGLINHIPLALDIFFREKDNEYGIYLEDDTLPSLEFFKFQKELLPRFVNNKKIFCINGTNFFPNKLRISDSYYLTQIPNIWGCGIYKRSWMLYEKYPKNYKKILDLRSKDFIFSKKYNFYINTYIEAINNKKLNTWDIQLTYSLIKNKMFAIAPRVNLVNNIGFMHKEATNTFISNYYFSFGKILPIKHPKRLIYDKNKDIIYFNNLLKGGWLRLWLIKIYLYLPDNIKNYIKNFIVFLKKIKIK